MNKTPFNGITVLSLGSAFCAFIVILSNISTPNSSIAGIFAIASLVLTLIAAPLTLKRAEQHPIVK